MEIIIHKINSIKDLKLINHKYGVEIDIRSFGSDLILNHDPFQSGERLEDYLDNYSHGTLVLNIKEAGIENHVIKLIEERKYIDSYFLLDIEFPYLFKASRKGQKNLAVRFSEDESIEIAKNYIDMVKWVWIDTITKFPINENNVKILNHFKKCLVCPERWEREHDIIKYKNLIKRKDIKIDAVMTSLKFAKLWLK